MPLHTRLISLSFVFSLPANAVGEIAQPAIGTSAIVSQVVSGLGLVIVFILILAWLVKRLGAGSVLQPKSINVLSSLPMGTREKIVLVEVENKKILLGVAPGNISSLHVFDNGIVNIKREPVNNSPMSDRQMTDDENLARAEKSNFSHYLKYIIKDGSQS